MNAGESVRARDVQDVLDAIGDAASSGAGLEIRGGGSKRGIGRPVSAARCLDLGVLSGVIDYVPDELVLTARAATPLAEIDALIEASGQMLAFEPMDYGPLNGLQRGLATLGGALAANVSGPRRLSKGAARDHFLGFQAVSGRGEAFKAGGRVVKNVTGFDLPKLMAGSWGTLAVLTEVTVKVTPRPRASATVLIAGLEDRDALMAMSRALGSAAEVSGAAHLPARLAARASLQEHVPAGRSVTALRLEGIEPSVAARIAILCRLFSASADLFILDAEGTHTLWRCLRDAEPFVGDGRPLWRISAPPMNAWAIPAALGDIAADWFYDWAGGLLWLAVPQATDAFAHRVRQAMHAAQGHATLVRAPFTLRSRVDCFEPQSPGVRALCQRVKAAFDPRGILNPGRMQPQISSA